MDWASMGWVLTEGHLPPRFMALREIAIEQGWKSGGTSLVARLSWPESPSIPLALFMRWDLAELREGKPTWRFGGARFNRVTPDWAGNATQKDVESILRNPHRLLPPPKEKKTWAW